MNAIKVKRYFFSSEKSEIFYIETFLTLFLALILIIAIGAFSIFLIKSFNLAPDLSLRLLPIAQHGKGNISPGIIPAKKNIKESIKPAQKKYIVSQGDTLWSISERYYKTGFKWQEIATANGILNPSQLSVGSMLSIPNDSIQENTKLNQLTLISAKEMKYNAIKGDTLWAISEKFYGDGYKYKLIAAENGIKNPDLIYEGQSIRLKL